MLTLLPAYFTKSMGCRNKQLKNAQWHQILYIHFEDKINVSNDLFFLKQCLIWELYPGLLPYRDGPVNHWAKKTLLT